MADKKHPSDQVLESALDRSLAPERFEEVLRHVAACTQCEQRMEQAEAAVASYTYFRNRVAPMFPQPSAPWSNIWDAMDRVERERLPGRPSVRPIWLSATAVAIVAALLLFWPRPDSTLRAET